MEPGTATLAATTAALPFRGQLPEAPGEAIHVLRCYGAHVLTCYVLACTEHPASAPSTFFYADSVATPRGRERVRRYACSVWYEIPSSRQARRLLF